MDGFSLYIFQRFVSWKSMTWKKFTLKKINPSINQYIPFTQYPLYLLVFHIFFQHVNILQFILFNPLNFICMCTCMACAENLTRLIVSPEKKNNRKKGFYIHTIKHAFCIP